MISECWEHFGPLVFLGGIFVAYILSAFAFAACSIMLGSSLVEDHKGWLDEANIAVIMLLWPFFLGITVLFGIQRLAVSLGIYLKGKIQKEKSLPEDAMRYSFKHVEDQKKFIRNVSLDHYDDDDDALLAMSDIVQQAYLQGFLAGAKTKES